MVAVPAATPVIVDVVPVAVAVATEVLLLDHAPPDIPSESVVVAPLHTGDVPPLIGPAELSVIVSTHDVEHPDKLVYPIVDVPAIALPVTKPVEGFIVASDVLLLDHVPPLGVAVKVVVVDIHIDSEPLITGIGLTVTVLVASAGHPLV